MTGSGALAATALSSVYDERSWSRRGARQDFRVSQLGIETNVEDLGYVVRQPVRVVHQVSSKLERGRRAGKAQNLQRLMRGDHRFK